jgi:hypothetical protein
MLYADRRAGTGDVHHSDTGAGDLCNFLLDLRLMNPLSKSRGCGDGKSRETFQTVAAVATSFNNFRIFLTHSRREIESEPEGRSRLACG